MSIAYNHLRVRIDLERLRANYRLLRAAAGPQGRLMPVVKADAYGHGLHHVARALAAEGVDILAVGSVGEAAELRVGGFGGRIVSLLGPVEESDYTLMTRHGIIPLLGRQEQLRRMGEEASRVGRVLPVGLKFDTGMSRLGFAAHQAEAVVGLLAAEPSLAVELAVSHLATADDEPLFDYAGKQGQQFAAVVSALRSAGHTPLATLANSAGLLAHEPLRHDLQRPGIALYGANPFHDSPLEKLAAGLAPVMSVSAPVLEVRSLEAGDSVSYGCTFTADRPMRIAVVGAGYADGYSRGLSSRGAMCVRGIRAPILGRVCMQLTMVDVSHPGCDGLEPGARAWLLGGDGEGQVTPEDLAGWWGTITYEVFCLLGLNPREYVG